VAVLETIAILRFIDEKIPRAVLKALIQPVLTALMFLLFGFALLSIRTGGVVPAWNAAFIEKHTPSQMQIELRLVAKRDALINRIMDGALSQSPTAARIRLGLVHNGAYGLAGASILRYDITHARAREGYSAGQLSVNSPLSNWAAFSDSLVHGQCVADGFDKWSAQERLVLLEMGADFRVICPVIAPDKLLLGALYMTWSGGPHPTLLEIEKLNDVLLNAGRQIAIAVEAGTQP
jgi:hypothetical protein